MNTKTKFKILAGSLFLSLFIIISSCEKDDNLGTTPELPPAEALIMDFSDFSNPDDTLGTTMALNPELILYTYRNWGHSYTQVLFWNTMATGAIAIPAYCYVQALENDPVYKGDNTWEWVYSFTFNTVTFQAKVVGQRISNEEFKAEMFISRTGLQGFENFKWVEGIVRYDRTHASWTLYESNANPVSLLEIDWNKNWENNTGDIKYTYTKPGTNQTGAYIRYVVTTDPSLDAGYTIALPGDTTVIEWNRTNKNGHVKSSVRFGDTDWHCWDIY